MTDPSELLLENAAKSIVAGEISFHSFAERLNGKLLAMDPHSWVVNWSTCDSESFELSEEFLRFTHGPSPTSNAFYFHQLNVSYVVYPEKRLKLVDELEKFGEYLSDRLCTRARDSKDAIAERIQYLKTLKVPYNVHHLAIGMAMASLTPHCFYLSRVSKHIQYRDHKVNHDHHLVPDIYWIAPK